MAKDFSDVPPQLLVKILMFAPVDARARACCVCPTWRGALASPALWTRLDLSITSGVTCSLAGKGEEGGALRALSARARGDPLNPGPGLETLDVTGRRFLYHALREVVADNAGTLRELRTISPDVLRVRGEFEEPFHPDDYVHDLRDLSLGSALQVLEADMCCDYGLARRMLLNLPGFERLRLRRLEILFDDETDFSGDLAAALVAHPSLQQLELRFLLTPLFAEEMSPLLDAALTLRLSEFSCVGCCPTPAVAPALARLLSGSALTHLSLVMEDRVQTGAMLDEPSAALLADALRDNRTLKVLRLVNVRLWDNPDAGVLLLGALTGHVSLCTLDCADNRVPDAAAGAAIGAALGALVAADSPTFEKLVLHHSGFGDAGLGPLVNALRYNTHLRTLHMHWNMMSPAFAERQLLPAVRANTSLWDLQDEKVEGFYEADFSPAEVQAVELVRARQPKRTITMEEAVWGGDDDEDDYGDYGDW